MSEFRVGVVDGIPSVMKHEGYDVLRYTTTQWATAPQSTIILAQDQVGFDTTTNTIKLGDGINVWASLTAIGGNATAVPSMALRLNGLGHIWAGGLYRPNVKLKDCWLDMRVRPTLASTPVTNYFTSPGYGGTHISPLVGYESNATHFRITGNVWDADAAAVKSFQTGYWYPLNQWYNIAVGVTVGGKIAVYVSGVAEASTAYSAPYRSAVGDVSAQGWFFGGSNHLNGSFDALWVRLFENAIPHNIGLLKAYRAERQPLAVYLNSDVFVNASLCYDLTYPQNIIKDISRGMGNGQKQLMTQTVVSAAGITGNGNGKSVVTAHGMPNSPKTVLVPLTIATHTTAALIANAFNTAYLADPDVSTFFTPTVSGVTPTLEAKNTADNDLSMNFTIEDDTSAGITDDLTAVRTTDGVRDDFTIHNGVREGLRAQLGDFNDPNSALDAEADWPQWIELDEDPNTKPTITVSAVPANAVFSDHFQRLSIPEYDEWDDITLGNTEGGSDGILPWTGSASSYGIHYSGVYLKDEGFGGMVYVTPSISNIRVKIVKNGDLNLEFRRLDANNFMDIQVAGATLYVSKTIAGVRTTIYGNAVEGISPDSTGYVEFVMVGDNFKVYYNGVLTGCNVTSVPLPTGKKIGFSETSYGLERMRAIDGFVP